MCNAIGLMPLYHRSVEEFSVFFPLFQPSDARFLSLENLLLRVPVSNLIVEKCFLYFYGFR